MEGRALAPGPGPEQIRALRAENPKARARDFAAAHGITEADLVAAHVGTWRHGAGRDPDRLLPRGCRQWARSWP
jgi:putative hemin transport protein